MLNICLYSKHIERMIFFLCSETLRACRCFHKQHFILRLRFLKSEHIIVLFLFNIKHIFFSRFLRQNELFDIVTVSRYTKLRIYIFPTFLRFRSKVYTWYSKSLPPLLTLKLVGNVQNDRTCVE